MYYLLLSIIIYHRNNYYVRRLKLRFNLSLYEYNLEYPTVFIKEAKTKIILKMLQVTVSYCP